MATEPAQSTSLAAMKAGQIATGKEIKNPVAAALAKSLGAMKAVLPKHMTPERMARMALGVLRTNKKLNEVAKGNPESFAHAVVQASQLGLEIGVFGEAHLVPFKDEIVLIPGYQGLVKLAKNSGQVIDIYAHEVRANDKFKLKYGLSRDLEHEPLSNGGFPAGDKERGDIVGFYAVAVYRDGTKTFLAMGLPEIIKTRDESRGYQMAKKFNKESPWDTQFPAMGRKTVVRRLCNWLPKSAELQMALDVDTAGEQGQRAAIEGDFVVIPEEEEPTSGQAGKDNQPESRQGAAAGSPDVTADSLVEQMRAVKSKDAADAILDLSRGLSQEDQAKVRTSYENRLQVLSEAQPTAQPVASRKRASGPSME